MPLPLYSKLLAAIAGGTGTTTVGPVPAGFIWIVRDVDGVGNGSGAAGTLYLELIDPSAAIVIFAAFDLPATGNTNTPWRGRQVLPEGWSLRVLPAGAYWQGAISGYQLSSP